MNFSRRLLLSGISASAFISTALPGVRVAFAADGSGDRDIMVVIYLRGGSDGLQMVSPAGDPNYIALRPTIRVPTTGSGAGFGLSSLGGVDFYMNPSAPELRDLFTSGKLAVVHATGVPNGNRSHFEAQDSQELGAAPGEIEPDDGWLTRHVLNLSEDRPLLGTVASGPSMPNALLGYTQGLAIPNAETFNVSGGNTNANLIRSITTGTSAYKMIARNTLDAVATVQDGLGSSANDSNVSYSGSVGNSLKSLARLIKMDVGLDVATVDHQGWDQHNNLLTEFATQAQDLSKSLAAFWADLKDYQSRLTVVTMTEFGRRIQENESEGTDHGSASYMMVLGGATKGGKIYGTWPGLAASQQRNGDLVVTTDYRHVLSEILVKRQGQAKITDVFPTLAYNPLGILN